MAITITFVADNPAEVVSVNRLRLFTGADYVTGLLYDNITGGSLVNGSYGFSFASLAANTYYPVVTVSYTDGLTSDVNLAAVLYPPQQAFSYSGNPANSTLDSVRFLLGDTDSSDPLLTNAAINFLVVSWVDVYSAAAAGAEQIAGKFAREVAYNGDGVAVDFSTLQDKYMVLAGQLRTLKKRIGRLAVPYVGGMLRSQIATAIANTDESGTLFAVGMNDDYRYGGSDATTNITLLKSNQQYGGAST